MILSEPKERTTIDASRAPSFVDLRVFAAEAAEYMPQSGQGDGFLANRVALINAKGETPVTALSLIGSGIVDALSNDEFLLILEGQLVLDADGESRLLRADDAVVIPKGTAFAWRAEETVTAVVMSYADSKAEGRTITPITKSPPLEPSGKPAADVLIGPAPDCRNFNDYRVDDGKFVCGTWDSTAYRRRGFVYGHYEIMHILQGSVTFGDEHGREGTFVTGSVVLAEAGSQCSWDSREHVTKVFAIYRV